MFCQKCGAQIMNGVRFCGNCGAATPQAPTPVQMQPVVNAAPARPAAPVMQPAMNTAPTAAAPTPVMQPQPAPAMQPQPVQQRVCSKCGSEVAGNSQFCPKCGAQVAAAVVTKAMNLAKAVYEHTVTAADQPGEMRMPLSGAKGAFGQAASAMIRS